MAVIETQYAHIDLDGGVVVDKGHQSRRNADFEVERPFEGAGERVARAVDHLRLTSSQIDLQLVKEAEPVAVAYADQENYPKAIAALREALERAQSDSDRYLIYYNIAAAHLNSNNLDEAEKYLELARQINDNEEISELQSNINHARAAKKKPFRTRIDG